MISLNRFTLDYETFQRVKITDRVSFPLTLNMNDYMKGYEGIDNKLYDKEVALVNQYDKKTVEKNLAAQEQKRTALEERKKEREGAEERKDGEKPGDANMKDEEPVITDPKQALQA